jgi:signal transduction histidine kinase
MVGSISSVSLAPAAAQSAPAVGLVEEKLETLPGDVRHEYETELTVANQRLEGQVAELQVRTHELEAANQAKGRFLVNMSHELRPPVDAVIGMCGLLLDTQLTAEQRQCAGIAKAWAESLLTLLSDILDYSKIEAGELKLETVNFNPRELIENTVNILGHQAQRTKLELLSFVDPRIPSLLKGDPARLQQVLINFTSNAIRFTEKGEVVLRADLIDQSDNDALLRFSVRDTGIGILPERMAHLFNSFESVCQIEATAARKQGGTGLGLAICKQLAKLMQGKIGVESRPGEGSTFWLECRLPIGTPAEQDQQPTDS